MEEDILTALAGIRTPLLDSFMTLVSATAYYIIALAPALYLYTKPGRRAGIPRLLISIGLAGIIIMAMKETMLYPRPCFTLPVGVGECYDPQESFPSGHTAIAFTPLPYLAGTPAFIPYAIYATLVGLSRLYLGAHYPHDVLAGMLIGLAIGWLGRTIGKKQKRSAQEV
ncbi:MAG: phosphatase PAP2 family protein [Candidatus Altiarchaeota archaeon]|nr:phosphatase PAP2 family protein [Candidatus Altiarchaeota archaeon]